MRHDRPEGAILTSDDVAEAARNLAMAMDSFDEYDDTALKQRVRDIPMMVASLQGSDSPLFDDPAQVQQVEQHLPAFQQLREEILDWKAAQRRGRPRTSPQLEDHVSRLYHLLKALGTIER